MQTVLRPAIVLLLLLTAITGFAYPLAITGIAQTLLPDAANGSRLVVGGKVVGSALIGQAFTSERYFHPRPSAAGASGYDASASSGSNLGPLSAKLLTRVQADVAKLREQGAELPVPADAVTASGSGLDPDISPDYAELQTARIAKARGVDAQSVAALIAEHAKSADFGLVGEPRINVLRLNLALDAAFGAGSG
jgi:K+-transporting ATPase ATPase C chain